ncbi:subtype B tannase [Streptomyces sp. CA-249302]|uniref:subtype B tannase n=1 Tax=Streptomyces sp. CA-249302 TaxID=3240058 RepID=UPI003D8F6BBF
MRARRSGGRAGRHHPLGHPGEGRPIGRQHHGRRQDVQFGRLGVVEVRQGRLLGPDDHDHDRQRRPLGDIPLLQGRHLRGEAGRPLLPEHEHQRPRRDRRHSRGRLQRTDHAGQHHGRLHLLLRHRRHRHRRHRDAGCDAHGRHLPGPRHADPDRRRRGGGNGAGQGATASQNNALYALAHGWVVVEPGVRGRDNVNTAGVYFGKAPDCIVDLKAAVRYLRHNKHRIPGNTDWIVSGGGSAGAALSSLLGASGDSPLYHRYLKEIGAADESDAVFATTAYSPITDLDHADMAYEWMFGTLPLASGAKATEPYSTELTDAYTDYQQSLHLRGIEGFGRLSADNYADYMVNVYLQPSATAYLTALPDADRATYLANNTFINWSDGQATFTWDGFLSHIGKRMKNAPSFDTLDASAFENQEFGDATTNARHFTLYSLRTATGNDTAQLDADLPEKIRLMNPMYFLGQRNPHRSRHWWLRTGALDTNTSHNIVLNLAAKLDNLGDDVDSYLYWDGGHAVNQDADAMIAWINNLTGHRPA